MHDLLHRAVDHAVGLGAKYAEARYVKRRRFQIVVKNGEVDAVNEEELKGVGVRVLVGKALAFASTTVTSWEGLKEAVEWAVRLAGAVRKSSVEFAEQEPATGTYELKPERAFEDVSLEEKASDLLEADARISVEGAKFPFRAIFYNEFSEEKVFVNSEGAEITQIIPRGYVLVNFAAVKEGKSDTRMFMVGSAGGYEFLERWRLAERLEEEARSLAMILEAERSPEGIMDVVLGPEVSGLMAHECVGHPFEADRILGREGAQAGESFVDPDMLGEKVGSEALTVIDDPTIEGSFGFYFFDDEGVRARPRYLIREGVITEFLHNRETAKVFGTKSNAAARAESFNREPIVRMANTYFAPGDRTFEELIEDIKFGVYIKTFGEWNIDDLRYNQRYIGKEAWLIERGEITKPVRGPVLEITTPAFYRSVEAADKTLEFEAAICGKGDPGQGIPVFTGGPNLKLKGVRIRAR